MDLWPDPLRFDNGRLAAVPADWPVRRAGWLALFEEEMYGPAPAATPAETKTLREETRFGGAATLREVRVHTGALGPVLALQIFPRRADGPFPTFIGLHFTDAATFLADASGVLERALRRGYGVVSACYEELAPDRLPNRSLADAPIYRSGYRAISLWAWGLSRLVDAFAADPSVDAGRLIAQGHSRLGKAALLAAARDERFAAAIPHQSGCGGAAPSRGTVGESVRRINESFPHWFADAFKSYNDRPQALPFDQHCLLACCAPRPVLFTNAVEDTWANPAGQFDVLKAADPVYRLLGAEGLESPQMPPVGTLSAGRLGFWLRPGKHSIEATDGETWLAWTDRHLPPGSTPRP